MDPALKLFGNRPGIPLLSRYATEHCHGRAAFPLLDPRQFQARARDILSRQAQTSRAAVWEERHRLADEAKSTMARLRPENDVGSISQDAFLRWFVGMKHQREAYTDEIRLRHEELLVHDEKPHIPCLINTEHAPPFEIRMLKDSVAPGDYAWRYEVPFSSVTCPRLP